VTDFENLAQLRGAIETTLGALIPRDRPCALVDFPNYTNVGDSAIWVGERAVLDDLEVDVGYTADRTSFRRRTLERRVGRGPILITGGGNFGDLWPAWQEFREEVVTAFPKNRIIQLPQSIHFAATESLDRARAALQGHPDFVVLVRDLASLKTAREDLCVEASLCPDMAFGLRTLSRPGPPETEILWLGRDDRERLHRPQAGQDIEIADWLEEPESALQSANVLLVRLVGRSSGGIERLATKALEATYDRLAQRRLGRGCSLVASARVVITDRLHAHILCVLLGIPHVLLDNSYGKVRSFYEAWTSECSFVRWAGSTDDALVQARALLAEAASETARAL
jgi:exopolysaccharide biosynthesis predicted pyruvyltransferase EpsI